MQKATKDARLGLTGSTNRNYAVDMRSEAQVLHLVIATVVVMWVLEAPQFKYYKFIYSKPNVRSSLFILRLV